MADNDEAGGSQIGGGDPMQAFIENELTSTFKSMFPTVCEFVRTWMNGGQVGPPTSTERHIGNGPKTPSATEKGSVSPTLSLM